MARIPTDLVSPPEEKLKPKLPKTELEKMIAKLPDLTQQQCAEANGFRKSRSLVMKDAWRKMDEIGPQATNQDFSRLIKESQAKLKRVQGTCVR